MALGELLRWPRPGAGGVAGTAPQSGLALLALLLAMLVCSSPCVRRGGHFEVIPWEFPAGMMPLGAPRWQFGVPGIFFPTEQGEWFLSATGVLGRNSWVGGAGVEFPKELRLLLVPWNVAGEVWDGGRCWDWKWMGLRSFLN